MSFLPISIHVGDKKILIVGGGKVALQKLKNLLPFCKNILVVAPEILHEIRQYATVQVIQSEYSPQYLNGIFLVYACTDSGPVNEQVYFDAETKGILCNRSDCAEKSHFHSSAIIESDELILGINSKKKDRKKLVAYKNELKDWLNEKEELNIQKEQQKGKVYLVGFGPGNPDLLTLRGEKLLRQADEIFYDDLLDAQALSKYPGNKVYVGKRRGNHSKVQAQINHILYQSAIQGNMVVRLKGGDPLIFGRGSEERYYLEARGISVEIIPGISSAIAAAAYGNIPLTHRGISSSVAFGTAHGKNSFKILESDTSVYYMGAKNMVEIAQKYIDNGYPDDFPVGLVYKASFPDQQIIKTTVSEVAKGNIKIESPIISIFGNTVNYKSILDKAQTDE
jgi:uroporphyrin-III C-methyltransferase / precorrin-2 dehydrogenase / sirohydrochlorin ferrochelatase